MKGYITIQIQNLMDLNTSVRKFAEVL